MNVLNKQASYAKEAAHFYFWSTPGRIFLVFIKKYDNFKPN